jgi:hypothetical protein
MEEARAIDTFSFQSVPRPEDNINGPIYKFGEIFQLRDNFE